MNSTEIPPLRVLALCWRFGFPLYVYMEWYINAALPLLVHDVLGSDMRLEVY
jgi:hypothetical protein